MDSESQFVLVPAPAVRPSARTQSGYIALLDTTKGPCNRVMKVPPVFFRGAFKSAMRLALQQIVSGMEIQNQLWISSCLVGCHFFWCTKCFLVDTTFREGGAYFGIQKNFLGDTKTFFGDTKNCFGDAN